MLVFVTVVEHHGYSAAGRHLNLAQATVSHHVHELERHVGTKLLVYEHRTVCLTPAGTEVYHAARTMLREELRLKEALADLRQGRRGRVRLGASMAFEQRYFFHEVVAPFRRAHEGLLLSLRFGHSHDAAKAVLDHELDIAYVLGWDLPDDVHFEPVHDARFRFLVPDGHPLTDRRSVTAADIAEVGLITAPLSETESHHYERILRECGLDGTDSVLEIDGMQARVLAAEAGLGVFGTFYPSYAGDRVAGGLVALDLDGPQPEVTVGLVTPTADELGGSVGEVAEWIRNLPRRGNALPERTSG